MNLFKSIFKNISDDLINKNVIIGCYLVEKESYLLDILMTVHGVKTTHHDYDEFIENKNEKVSPADIKPGDIIYIFRSMVNEDADIEVDTGFHIKICTNVEVDENNSNMIKVTFYESSAYGDSDWKNDKGTSGVRCESLANPSYTVKKFDNWNNYEVIKENGKERLTQLPLNVIYLKKESDGSKDVIAYKKKDNKYIVLFVDENNKPVPNILAFDSTNKNAKACAYYGPIRPYALKLYYEGETDIFEKKKK